jgi:hypothetical protein
MTKKIHYMDVKNWDELTGECRNCGPVKMTVKGECSIAKKLRRERRPANKNRTVIYKGETQDLVLNERDIIAMKEGKSCEICGRSDIRLHIDHCHTKGVFRGILCVNCNMGIGNLKDNVEILRAAIVYLENHQISSVRTDGSADA